MCSGVEWDGSVAVAPAADLGTRGVAERGERHGQLFQRAGKRVKESGGAFAQGLQGGREICKATAMHVGSAPFRTRDWQIPRFRVTPFVGIYLATAWVAAVLISHPDVGQESLLFFHIPDLRDDVSRAVVALTTAPWLNAGPLQLVYVTVLLLVFGTTVEAREGTRTTALIFFGASAGAALVAGAMLHLLYPGVAETSTLERAWERAWGGGSAGCFGLMGALAARSAHPWAWMTAFMVWETQVWFWKLQNYTPVFHFAALAIGFLAARAVIGDSERWDHRLREPLPTGDAGGGGT